MNNGLGELVEWFFWVRRRERGQQLSVQECPLLCNYLFLQKQITFCAFHLIKKCLTELRTVIAENKLFYRNMVNCSYK